VQLDAAVVSAVKNGQRRRRFQYLSSRAWNDNLDRLPHSVEYDLWLIAAQRHHCRNQQRRT
jgi:hypothetical protein